MSKLYTMNRMRSSPAAGDILSTGLKIGGGLLKGVLKLFKGKTAQAVVKGAKYAITSPAAQAALAAGAGGLAGALMAPGGGGGGASGGWTRRRRKGITGAELRGFHKVARLLHKEGMVVKHARRGK
jgi:hypothetical protein